MKQIKFIMSDLDGTLLKADKRVSNQSKEAIRACRQKGMKFGIASGRPVEPVLNLIKEWDMQDMVDCVIGMNGGVFFNTRTLDKEEFYLLDGDTLKGIMNHFQGFDIRYWIFDGETRYVSYSDEKTRSEALLFGECEIQTDMDELCNQPRNKIIIECDPSYMTTVEKHAATYKNKNCVGFKSADCLFEFVDPRVNKSFGLKQLCEEYQITMNNILAFGDTSNDNEMLRDAGIGVCMENGTDDTKAMADVLTLSNEEEGIAHYINQFIL